MGVHRNQKIRLVRKTISVAPLPTAVKPDKIPTSTRYENLLLDILRESSPVPQLNPKKKYFARTLMDPTSRADKLIVDTLIVAFDGILFSKHQVQHNRMSSEPFVGNSNGRLSIDPAGTWEFHHHQQTKISVRGIWEKDENFNRNSVLQFRIQKLSPEMAVYLQGFGTF